MKFNKGDIVRHVNYHYTAEFKVIESYIEITQHVGYMVRCELYKDPLEKYKRISGHLDMTSTYLTVIKLATPRKHHFPEWL